MIGNFIIVSGKKIEVHDSQAIFNYVRNLNEKDLSSQKREKNDRCKSSQNSQDRRVDEREKFTETD